MKFEGTTIVAVKRYGKCAIAGDGQVTFGENTIMKHTAKKVRRVYHNNVAVGFAGSVADAFSLCERFEAKLEQYNGNLKRAAVSLAQEWRSDKALRDPDDDIATIGSGGMYALAAAKALKQNTELSAREIATKSIAIASEICVYTNNNITVEEV